MVEVVKKRIDKIHREHHNKVYINWSKEGKTDTRLFKEELISKVEELKSLGYTQVKHSTIRKNYKPLTFSILARDKYIILTYYDGSKYYKYVTNYKDDKKNDPDIYKVKVFKEFHDRFKKRTNKTLKESFGSIGQYIKVCVPKNFYYRNSDYPTKTIIRNVGKLDFSSMFPSTACGKLPTTEGLIMLEGTVKPNEEYPFAFYVKSGHTAEYGVYDTHDWINSKYKEHILLNKENYQGDIYLSPDKDRTILMKASTETLDDEMLFQYNVKQSFPKDSKEYKSAKLFLLKIIGMFEQNKKQAYDEKPFAHLAAIIKCRAIKKMFDLINTVGDENVIQIILDGMIYKGKEAYGTKDKYLGACVQEFVDGRMIHLGINGYIIQDDNHIDGAHAGYDIRTDGKNIDEYDTLTDIMKWKKSDKVDYLQYLNTLVNVEEIRYEKNKDE